MRAIFPTLLLLIATAAYAEDGFTNPDNVSDAADARKVLATFTVETDIDKGTAEMSTIEEGIGDIYNRMSQQTTTTTADYAAYDKLRGEFTTAIDAKTAGGDIPAQRYAGVAKATLAKLASVEDVGNDIVVEHIVHVDGNALGKFMRDLNAQPASTKDLSTGYPESRWAVPFKHAKLPDGEPEVLFIPPKDLDAPAILSHPALDGGSVYISSIIVERTRTLNGVSQTFNLNVRKIDPPDAAAVWQFALQLDKVGAHSEAKNWPRALKQAIYLTSAADLK
jgi:hypothetical protein